MNITPEQIDMWMSYIKRRMTEASTISMDMQKGIERGVDSGWSTSKYNGTETITIKINGGAMDT